MSTIKYQLRSDQNKHVPIYLSFSMGRGATFRCKTGFSINPKDWSEKRGFPKPTDEANKKLILDLKELESFLLDHVNDAQSRGAKIDKDYIDLKINECFNRVEPTDKTLLRNHVQYIIDNAQTRKVPGKNKIGLSLNTVKNYKTFLKMVQNYEVYLRRPIHFMDLDFNFVEGFKHWLLNVQEYSINHAGKAISFLKFVAVDAERFGVPINPYAYKIETFTESDEDRQIVTLSLHELETIKNADLDRDALINSRKWFVLGCFTGQRVEDLLKLTEQNVRRTKEGSLVIDLKQQKTKKEVTIPVLPEAWEIIKDGFPYLITEQNFNEYIKKVAEIAGISQPIEGKKFDKESKRKVLGVYPKFDLITSHSCRRSFATNFYKKIPTTILMGITGHTKESTFLKYINKQKDKDDNARLFLEYLKS
ncbi:site-specific integrase [Pararhodonellum marinum]|uniref:site-specific integrase n=1 Tax=Pararhodonellum marinum TaxID=2755358 RepID=UPI00188F871D|nr:site-specific integrase [Pararhodonellum marinum]